MGDSQLQMTAPKQEQNKMLHNLLSEWTLWAHLPHDTDWSLKSYKNISSIKSVEEIIALYDAVPEKVVKNCMLFLTLVGESLISKKHRNNITGITISPKKNFCIIKIWMSDCNNQDPTTISYFEGIDSRGCLFKKHNPEY